MGAKVSGLLKSIDLNHPLDEKQAEEMFKVYDKDNTGFLEKGEVDQFLREWCKVNKISDADKEKVTREFWKAFDPQNVGKIPKTALFLKQDAPKESKPAQQETKDGYVKVAETKETKDEGKQQNYKLVPTKDKHKKIVDEVIAEHTEGVEQAPPAHIAEFNRWFLNPKNLAEVGKGLIHYMFERWIKESGEFIQWRVKPSGDNLVAIISNVKEVARVLDENVDRGGNTQSVLLQIYGPNAFCYIEEKPAAEGRAAHPIVLAGTEWLKQLEPLIVAETKIWAEKLKQEGIFDLQTATYSFIFEILNIILIGESTPHAHEQFVKLTHELDKNGKIPTATETTLAESAAFGNIMRAALNGRCKTNSPTVTRGYVTFQDLCGKMLEMGKHPSHGGVMQNEFVSFFSASALSTASTLATVIFYGAKEGESTWVYARQNPKRGDYLLCEAWRLHAPVPIILRQAHPGDKVLGHTFEKKSMVMVCPFAQQRAAQNFGPDGEINHPGRWASPDKMNKQAFIPFGNGRRECLGKDLAWMLLRVVIETLLQADIAFRCNELLEPTYKHKMFCGATIPSRPYSIKATSFNSASKSFEDTVEEDVTQLKRLFSAARISKDMKTRAKHSWDNVVKCAKEEKSEVHKKLFEVLAKDGDPRLDYWTKCTVKIIEEKQHAWTKPQMESITIPLYKKLLPKCGLFNTPIEVPIEDEDWPLPTKAQMIVAGFLRDYTPNEDDFTHDWCPEEDKEAWVRRIIGNMWPRTNVYWNDRTSDNALERIAFLGLGQFHLQKLANPKWPDTYYGIELERMETIDVRPGFERYGANAYFSKEGKLLRIVRMGKEYLPTGSKEWEWVKMAFRGSLLLFVTALDHLLGVHATISNFLTTVSREHLSPNHPIRRFIKPFTFRSVYINYVAGQNLFSAGGFLHRAFALSVEGMAQTWKFGWDEYFRFEPLPARAKRMGVEAKIPFNEDGLDLWAIFEKFVGDYVDLYYPTQQDFDADAEMQAFWTEMQRIAPPRGKLPPLTAETLKAFLTYSFFTVTGGHNHLGTVAEYVADPAFCPTVLVKGKLANPPMYAIRGGLIMCATGFPQPRLLDDFRHVMLDEDAKRICLQFTSSLVTLSDVIDRRNLTRLQSRFIELSVSI